MLLSSFTMTLVLKLLSVVVNVMIALLICSLKKKWYSVICSQRIIESNSYPLLQSQLNLSLALSCKNPEIDNAFKTYKAITIFFNSSPKREGLLEHIVKSRCTGAEKRKVLVGMYQTRWSERDISYEHFYLAIPFMVEAFEIMNGTHPKNNDCDSVYKDGWNSKTKERRNKLLPSRHRRL